MIKENIQQLIIISLRLLSVFFIYFLCRLLFFLINKDIFLDVGFNSFLWYQLVGLRFDLTAILYLSLPYLVIELLPFPKSRILSKISFYLFIVPNLIGIAANIVDFAYFPYILQRSTFSIFDFILREGNIVGLVGSLMLEFWYIPILFVALSFLLINFNRKIPSFYIQKNKLNVNVILNKVVLLVLVLSTSIIGIRGGIQNLKPLNISVAGNYAEKPLHTSIILNTPFSIFLTYGFKKVDKFNFFSEKEVATVFNPEKSGFNSSNQTKPNVVILILESFNKEFSSYLNPKLDSNYTGYMPFLDSLMRESMVYPNAYANGRKSIQAVPAILSGIPSFNISYLNSIYSNNRVGSIASELKNKGYSTSFFHGADNGSMNFDAYCNLAGFDKYYGLNEYKKSNKPMVSNIWGIHDEYFLSYFSDELKQSKKPFLSVFFSLSSHTPFELPEGQEENFEEGKMPIHKMIRYTDYSLKKYFQSIKKEPWFDNTLFVITADHCTTPFYYNYKSSHKMFSIPLIFYQPNSENIGIDSTLVQQLDIMPTLLEKIGHNDSYFSFGNSISDTTNRFVVNYLYGNYRLLKDDYLLIYDLNEIVGFYNLKNDPMEKNNLKTSNNPIKKEMLVQLKGILQQQRNRMIDNQFRIIE